MSDDPIEHAAGSMMMTAGALAQAGGGVFRALQDVQRRRTERTEAETREARERVVAQAVIADQQLQVMGRAQWWADASPAEQRQAWIAVGTWRDATAADPELGPRFAEHEAQIGQRVEDKYGPELSAYLQGDGADHGVYADLIELHARRAQEQVAAPDHTTTVDEQESARPEQTATAGVEQRRSLDALAADEGLTRDGDVDRRDGQPVQAHADWATAQRDGSEADEHRAAATAALDGDSGPVSAPEVAWDSTQRRESDAAAMLDAGVDQESVHAKMVSDRGNGADPRRAAGAGKTTGTSQRRPGARTAQRSQDLTRAAEGL